MQISFLWHPASMGSQKDCYGFNISLFTAGMDLAVHPQLTTFLLRVSLLGPEDDWHFLSSKAGRVGTGAGWWTALFYLEKVNWNKCAVSLHLNFSGHC